MKRARATPLPPLTAVRTRDAAALGLTGARLRGPAHRRLSHGLYAGAADEHKLVDLARVTSPLLPPDAGFGHLTSAALRNWWLPNQFPTQPPILFASTSSRIHRQRHGLYVRRSAFAQIDELDGIPVVTAAETLLELANDLSLVDLVPLVDCALAQGTDPAEILAAARPGSRGCVVLRRAFTLSDPKSESWWESILRLIHVSTGLGPVESQVEIRLDGVLVARADLHLLGTARYPECDGGEHRTRERHEHDLRRDKAIDRLGLERYGYTTSEIARQPEMIIRDAEDARGETHRPSRAALWRRLAKPSTLTTYGQVRLLGRIERYRRAADR